MITRAEVEKAYQESGGTKLYAVKLLE